MEYRIVSKKLPERTVNARILEVRQKAKSQGRILRNIVRKLMNCGIMITNVDILSKCRHAIWYL